MTYEWTLYFCLFLALWSAVIGGVFSAFSEFVMSGLLRNHAGWRYRGDATYQSNCDQDTIRCGDNLNRTVLRALRNL